MDVMTMRRNLLHNRPDLPPIYKPCDYLQTTGYNSRIDTGVPGNDDTLVFDLDYATIVRQAYGSAFGNYLSEATRCWRLMNPSGTGDSRYYAFTVLNRRAGSSSSIAAVPDGESIVGKRINFRVSLGKCVSTYGSYSIDASPTGDGTTNASERNIAIGAPYPTQTGSGALVGRFWHFKIWSRGVLVRNYIPCIRQKDGKAGFWDSVNRTFNPSIGSVDFIAGYDQ